MYCSFLRFYDGTFIVVRNIKLINRKYWRERALLIGLYLVSNKRHIIHDLQSSFFLKKLFGEVIVSNFYMVLL